MAANRLLAVFRSGGGGVSSTTRRTPNARCCAPSTPHPLSVCLSLFFLSSFWLCLRFQKPGQPGGGGGGGGASGLISNLTAEQRSIVLADVKPGGVLTVLAFAGTGKTTCLRAYAQARPHLKILYLTVSASLVVAGLRLCSSPIQPRNHFFESKDPWPIMANIWSRRMRGFWFRLAWEWGKMVSCVLSSVDMRAIEWDGCIGTACLYHTGCHNPSHAAAAAAALPSPLVVPLVPLLRQHGARVAKRSR